ncbi:UNVERIFIED_ORG: P27 family predicted phage terminase small subunit [Heyndrickxia coagulans]
MARPKKLTDQIEGHRTKEELEERQEQEKALLNLTSLDVDNIPKWLDTKGKKEWKRIAPLMLELPISEHDRQMLAMYCNYVSVYEQCARALKKQGLTVIEIGSKGQAITKQNVNWQTMVQAGREIKSIASNLGLTLDARLRIMVPETGEKEIDPFSAMFDE